MWSSILAISCGAALGANARWLLGLWLNHWFPAVPLGTLAANWLGGWLIGLAIAFLGQQPQLAAEWRLFLITGLLGALTTFSTFSAEALANLQEGRLGVALLGIGLHVVGSIALAGLGMLTFQALKNLLGTAP